MGILFDEICITIFENNIPLEREVSTHELEFKNISGSKIKRVKDLTYLPSEMIEIKEQNRGTTFFSWRMKGKQDRQKE